MKKLWQMFWTIKNVGWFIVAMFVAAIMASLGFPLHGEHNEFMWGNWFYLLIADAIVGIFYFGGWWFFFERNDDEQ